jgi:hypothetical protein
MNGFEETSRMLCKSKIIQLLNSLVENLKCSLHWTNHRLTAYNREHKSTIMAKLEAIEASHKKMGIQDGSKLNLIREDILCLTKQTQQKNEMRAAIQGAQLASLKTKFEILQREQATCTRQVKVLESLYFPELRRRWYQIRKADQRSNEWVYDPQQTSFVSWLESERKDDGLFYITGRVCPQPVLEFPE